MKMVKKMAAAASAVMIAAMSVASITASAAIEFDAGDKIVAVDKGPYSAYLCLQAVTLSGSRAIWAAQSANSQQTAAILLLSRWQTDLVQ